MLAHVLASEVTRPPAGDRKLYLANQNTTGSQIRTRSPRGAPAAPRTDRLVRAWRTLVDRALWDLLANHYAATYLDASFVAAIPARR